jgi:hypothetical protein
MGTVSGARLNNIDLDRDRVQTGDAITGVEAWGDRQPRQANQQP